MNRGDALTDCCQLGTSGPLVARVGFGCCPMGMYGWGVVTESELMEAVREALARGISFFDTADVYGLGRSEELLGRALGGRRNEAVIASKFGVRYDAQGRTKFDNSGKWIRSALDASLARLRTDRIDLYQLHYGDGQTPLDDVLSELDRARSEGKIRYAGVTNVDLLAEGIDEPIPWLISFSHEYSLARRTSETAIQLTMNTLGMMFLSWGSLGQGILSGRYTGAEAFGDNDRRSRQVYRNFRGDDLSRCMRIVHYLQEIRPHYPGRSISQLAVRWILDQLPGAIALVGIKRPEQLRDIAGILDFRLHGEHHRQLDVLSSPPAGVTFGMGVNRDSVDA